MGNDTNANGHFVNTTAVKLVIKSVLLNYHGRLKALKCTYCMETGAVGNGHYFLL